MHHYKNVIFYQLMTINEKINWKSCIYNVYYIKNFKAGQ